MKIIVGLALFFSLCGIGNAQTQSSVKEFSDRLSEKQDVLSKISRNVLQMLQGSISENDQITGLGAYDSSQNLYGQLTLLLTVSYIHTHMVDERDIKTVKIIFDTVCKLTIEKSEWTVKSINKALPSIQSAALVNEVTKLRDAHNSILQTLEFCKTN